MYIYIYINKIIFIEQKLFSSLIINKHKTQPIRQQSVRT